MISRISGLVAILAAACVVSACEAAGGSKQMAEPTATEMMVDASAREPLKLLISGQDPDTAMADPAALRMTLLKYGVPEPASGNFKTWITDILNARNGFGSEVIGGVGGLPSRALLWLAEETLNPDGTFAFAPGADVHGQIQAECEGQPGYLFNADGSGRLCVTVFTTKNLGASGQTRTLAERFLVLVDAGGFHVEAKDPNNAATAFPAFTQASGMPIPQSLAANFDTKLWASGTSIHVIKLWRDMNYDPNNPNFHEVNLEAKPNQSIKAPNVHACIDMMFVGQPPATYADLEGPPKYCLGRCADPPIINTR